MGSVRASAPTPAFSHRSSSAMSSSNFDGLRSMISVNSIALSGPQKDAGVQRRRSLTRGSALVGIPCLWHDQSPDVFELAALVQGAVLQTLEAGSVDRFQESAAMHPAFGPRPAVTFGPTARTSGGSSWTEPQEGGLS